MGVIAEKQEQFKMVEKLVRELADTLAGSTGADLVDMASEEGSEEDPSAIVCLDVPSFMTFNAVEKKIFELAVAKCDIINFLAIENNWIRITFGIIGEYEREYTGTESTVVLDLADKIGRDKS